MSKRSISINRMEIRLRGVSPETARVAVKDLGHELLGRLSDAPGLSGGGRTVRVDKLETGVVPIAARSGPGEVRAAIAGQIAAVVRQKAGVRSQELGVRNQESGVRSQKSGVRS